ncbi:uncharacterized protein LOC125197385 [Salvia hispanica]|uniref:uncharacterized protein LOC125197385 n=1 Tax=Salvia hispanica TaxID=49212 RepID=UPI002009A376|nr:uncharacterized protein LOC125197385 [Salvia hispanica]
MSSRKICKAQRRPAGASEDDYRLKALPFVLKGEANTWFMRLPADSINTWADFKSVFLAEFFPSSNTSALKMKISCIRQEYDETLSEYWEKYMSLLESCPNHRMKEIEVHHTFNEGMNKETKDLANSSSGGDFTQLRVSEAKKVFCKLLNAKKTYDNARDGYSRESVATHNQNQNQYHNNHDQHNPPAQYNQYPQNQNQQNFSGYQSNPPPQYNQHQSSNQFHHPNKSRRSMEDMMGEMLASQQSIKSDLQSSNETMQGMQSAQKEHRANMDMMNRQLAQLANSVGEMKGNSGKLPSTVHVPEKTNVSKITLRSGTTYNGPQLKNPIGESSKETVLSDTISAEELKRPLPQMEDPFFLNEKPTAEGKEGETQPGNEQPEGAMPTSEPQTQEAPRESPQGLTGEAKGEKPFPYRFVTKRKKENPVDFMSIFGKLDVTIPFLQAVRLPPLGKFIKEFIAGKAQEDGKIMVEGIASTIVQEKLPPKRADPRGKIVKY